MGDRRSVAVFVSLLLLGSCALPARAQQVCQPPTLPPTPPGLNIFTPQQEIDLGDVLAEHIQHNFRVIDDESLTMYLTRVLNRVLRQLPATQLRFQVFLFELPVANAFSLPGGRIYFSRKLVAFVRNEDELAGLLGHEMGHILTHQGAIQMTRLFHEVLGVNEVGDRHDIFDKYNRLLEGIAKKPGTFLRLAKQIEPHQYQADQVSLYALANSGYAPQAFVDFWDRFAQTQGKTGGWFSDFWGITKPEEKRLREMRKSLSELPPGCQRAAAGAPSDQFRAWQAAVVAYSGTGRRENLRATLAKKSLDPPLRSDITQLHFSPDSRYLLAQDESSIYVLTRDPFELLLRIDAPDALPAQFTPDSNSLIFSTPGLRVEQWDIADQRQTSVHELVVVKGCLQSLLSPDGKTMACITSTFDLTLLDVDSGTTHLIKKEFFRPQSLYDLLAWLLVQLHQGDLAWANMGFSPDARYFAAGRGDTAIALDVKTRGTIPLRGRVGELLGEGFVFLGPDRLIGVGRKDPKRSAVVRFPSGEVITPVVLAQQQLGAPGHGNYALLRPLRDYPVGVLDLATGKILIANKTPALDIYDQIFVGERRDGELGLYEVGNGLPLALAPLPQSPLGRLRAAVVSPDLEWLAISEKNRGAVWNLSSARRMYYLRGFRGAYFDGDKAMYADFPKWERLERSIGRIDLTAQDMRDGIAVGQDPVEQYGRYLLVRKSATKSRDLSRDVVVDVRDIRNGATLWSANFQKEAPTISIDPDQNAMILQWPLSAEAARDEIEKAPARLGQFERIKEREKSCLLEVLDAASGNKLGEILVDTQKGAFRIEGAFVAADSVLITDTTARTLVYSLSTGEVRGRLFGKPLAFSKPAGLLGIQNELGQLILYQSVSLEKRDELDFSSPISLARFSGDGKRLFVLTANQTAFTLDVSNLSQPAARAATARH